MQRVMGGSARGRKLKSPDGLTFRPTTGRVKEFIFNILQGEVEGANVLDLFSGTGSLGIEALSRGARHVTFVEKAVGSLKLLNENLSLCSFIDQSTVLQGDVFKNLDYLGRQQNQFDFILADPPFKENYRQAIVKNVNLNNLLLKHAPLIVEHEKHDPDEGDHSLILERQRRFGACYISVYGV
ncbi:16S rRNA (guanine(966)-N(2))-methyltransferase RsmD [bacterium]|nr:16S rRNA (guanine(966)-N(2))-methyltransferase RsmD [bacterium]